MNPRFRRGSTAIVVCVVLSSCANVDQVEFDREARGLVHDGMPTFEVVPRLQQLLADKAVIDLKPFASNAQAKIAAAIADFQKNEDGVQVATQITSLRLADIAFDSKTLRVIAEAEGSISVTVTQLSGL